VTDLAILMYPDRLTLVLYRRRAVAVASSGANPPGRCAPMKHTPSRLAVVVVGQTKCTQTRYASRYRLWSHDSCPF